MNYAGPGLRAVEGIIDLAVTLVILWIVAKLSGQTTEGGFDLRGAPFFIGLAIVLGYFIALEATIGATLGKLVLRLRVVKAIDGSPIGWSESVARNVLRIVDGIILYLIGFILICTSEKRQRLGDKVASSVVVRIA